MPYLPDTSPNRFDTHPAPGSAAAMDAFEQTTAMDLVIYKAHFAFFTKARPQRHSLGTPHAMPRIRWRQRAEGPPTRGLETESREPTSSPPGGGRLRPARRSELQGRSPGSTGSDAAAAHDASRSPPLRAPLPERTQGTVSRRRGDRCLSPSEVQGRQRQFMREVRSLGPCEPASSRCHGPFPFASRWQFRTICPPPPRNAAGAHFLIEAEARRHVAPGISA